MNERIIFDAALEIADPNARHAFLDKACSGDAGLRASVEALLKSHDTAGSFLDVPAVEQVGQESAADTANTIVSNLQDVDDKEGDIDLSFLQPSTKTASIGTLGHYEILEVLGQGAFGIVFRAFDEKLHRHVAIKTMSVQMATTSPARKRFLREARAAAAIRHDNVVQVYSVEEQPLPYLVMEFIDGQTLQQKQRDHGPLDVPELLHIGRQIAAGLAAAHSQSLIHRDVKPGNILLEKGVEQKVKITDFGLARAADDASLTRSGMISGTPMYMAPEQALGQPLDHRSDLFSLGSVLYELATGRPPFRAPNTVAVLRRVVDDIPRPIQEIIPEIPDWLVAIINKLLEKQPDVRYQTAKEVADLMARCQSELQLTGQVTCVPGLSGSPHVLREESRTSTDANRANNVAPPTASPARSANFTRSVKATSDHVQHESPAAAHPTLLEVQSVAPTQKLTAKTLIFALLLAGMVMFPILFGRHLSDRFNAWYWPAIPTLPATELATGLNFDGKDDYVEIPVDWSFPQFTIEAFVTSEAQSDNGNIVTLLGGDATTLELMGLYDDSQADPGLRKSGAQIVGQPGFANVVAPLGVGVRQHRALVFDGTHMHYYVNGIWQGKRRSAARQAMQWKFSRLRIGSSGDDKKFFEGQIDQVRMSKVARYTDNFLPVTSVKGDDATLALYKFDEGQGDILKDASGHGHDGKIVGATWARASGAAFAPGQTEATDSTNPDRRAAEWVLSVGGEIRIKENDQERQIAGDLPLGAFVLTGVDLGGRHKVTDAGLAHFQDCKNLTHLQLANTQVSDAGVAHFKDCKNLTFLSLHSTKVGDPGLVHFKDCKNLTFLDLANIQVSDVGLAHFQDCKNLTFLWLDGPKLTDAGLGLFKDCKNLTHLTLSHSQVSDAGLAHFKDCRNLTFLHLTGTNVSDAGLAHFKEWKNLTEIHLQNTPVTDAGLAHFKERTNLTHLDLATTQVTDVGMVYFKECKNLTYLNLTHTSVSDAGLAHFKECKNLTTLFLKEIPVSDVGLAHFRDCKNLTQLDLGGSLLSDAGLAYFQDCKNLTDLRLDNTQVSDAALGVLAGLPNLTALNLANSRISLRGYEQLKAALPNCQIIWSEQNRSVAESVLALGGTVEIGSRDKPESRPIQFASDLPAVYFQVRHVSLVGVTKPLGNLPDFGGLRFPEFDRLESLDLSGIPVPEDVYFLRNLFLDRIHGLRDLTLDGPALHDQNSHSLGLMKQVKRLSLAGSGLTDAGIKRLADLTTLESLDLRRTKVTAAGIDELKAALPGCEIEWDGGVIEGGQK